MLALHLHRHIGGLENSPLVSVDIAALHRHIGGLEKDELSSIRAVALHRHIGGLEINFSYSLG